MGQVKDDGGLTMGMGRSSKSERWLEITGSSDSAGHSGEEEVEDTWVLVWVQSHAS